MFLHYMIRDVVNMATPSSSTLYNRLLRLLTRRLSDQWKTIFPQIQLSASVVPWYLDGSSSSIGHQGDIQLLPQHFRVNQEYRTNCA